MKEQLNNKFKALTEFSVKKYNPKHNELVIEDIYQIEIELLNLCNLACPLCARANPDVKNFIKSTGLIHLDFEALKKALSSFPKLSKVHLVGGICEPTLYKNFIPLLIWLKDNNYSLMISTNASTLNEEKWVQIGSILKKDDEIRFAIDGSTQERYEKYRVNGNLSKIINNIKAFNRTNSEAFKVLQVIKFKHNADFYEEEIASIQEQCNFKFDFIYRLATGSEAPELGLEYPTKNKKRIELFQKIFDKSNKRNKEELAKDIHCYSKQGFIYINHLGNFITCCDRYEDFLLDVKINPYLYRPSIYNFDGDLLIDYLNRQYKDIPNNEICIRYCHKMVQLLQEPDDRIVNFKD